MSLSIALPLHLRINQEILRQACLGLESTISFSYFLIERVQTDKMNEIYTKVNGKWAP